MAETNPHLKTLLKTLVLLLFACVLVLICLMSIAIYPSFHLVSLSATPLSNTTTDATWNVSLQVSNPNRLWGISYRRPHVSLLYTDKDEDFGSKVIADTYLGPFVQRRRAQKIFHPHLSVSVGKSLAERIVKDETQGLARFQVMATFPMRFKIVGHRWTMRNVFCSDINIVFNKIESGVASNLPKKCKSVGVTYHHY